MSNVRGRGAISAGMTPPSEMSRADLEELVLHLRLVREDMDDAREVERDKLAVERAGYMDFRAGVEREAERLVEGDDGTPLYDMGPKRAERIGANRETATALRALLAPALAEAPGGPAPLDCPACKRPCAALPHEAVGPHHVQRPVAGGAVRCSATFHNRSCFREPGHDGYHCSRDGCTWGVATEATPAAGPGDAGAVDTTPFQDGTMWQRRAMAARAAHLEAEQRASAALAREGNMAMQCHSAERQRDQAERDLAIARSALLDAGAEMSAAGQRMAEALARAEAAEARLGNEHERSALLDHRATAERGQDYWHGIADQARAELAALRAEAARVTDAMGTAIEDATEQATKFWQDKTTATHAALLVDVDALIRAWDGLDAQAKWYAEVLEEPIAALRARLDGSAGGDLGGDGAGEKP